MINKFNIFHHLSIDFVHSTLQNHWNSSLDFNVSEFMIYVSWNLVIIMLSQLNGILFIIWIEFSEGLWKLNRQQRDCVYMFGQKVSQRIFTHLKVTDPIPFVNPIAQTRAVGEMQWNTACINFLWCNMLPSILTDLLHVVAGLATVYIEQYVSYYQQERVFVNNVS